MPQTRKPKVNPKTGKPYDLTDKEMKAESLRDIERMRRRPQLATQFLKDLGLLTPTGKLSRKYGGWAAKVVSRA
jgi:hypothetical protein